MWIALNLVLPNNCDETVPSRFSFIGADVPDQYSPSRRLRCLPSGLREDRDNDDDTHDTFRGRVYNVQEIAAIFSLYHDR